MARKKVGKQRLDKYYHLAKDSGFRARSAFKLQQLHQKYNFLNSATSVLDLCAAPGGWLQVCMKEMPLHKLIIGVDLDYIRPLDGVFTIIGDITTDECRKEIKRLLNDNDTENQIITTKTKSSETEMKYDVTSDPKQLCVDVVLHDGAPNVGTEWSHDAYNQNVLVLHALKLSSIFLKKDGIFVTKVFRSENFSSLLWVFNQLFNGVDITKPLASRGESAEIFVVCRGFIKHNKISGDLFNPEYVFGTSVNNLTVGSLVSVRKMLTMKKKPAEGYDDTKFYKVMEFEQFLTEDSLMRTMLNFSKINVPESVHFFFDKETRAIMDDLKIININDFKKIVKKRDRFVKYLRSDSFNENINNIVENDNNKIEKNEGKNKIDENLNNLKNTNENNGNIENIYENINSENNGNIKNINENINNENCNKKTENNSNIQNIHENNNVESYKNKVDNENFNIKVNNEKIIKNNTEKIKHITEMLEFRKLVKEDEIDEIYEEPENDDQWKLRKIEEDIKREKRKNKKEESLNKLRMAKNRIFDLPDDDFFEDKLFETNFGCVNESESSENEITLNNNLSDTKNTVTYETNNFTDKKSILDENTSNKNKTIDKKHNLNKNVKNENKKKRLNDKNDFSNTNIKENEKKDFNEISDSDSESFDLEPNEIDAIIDLKKNEQEFIEKSIDRHCHDEKNLPEWYIEEEKIYNARIKDLEKEEETKEKRKKDKKEKEAIERRKKRAKLIVQKKLKSGKNEKKYEEWEVQEKNKKLEEIINESDENEKEMFRKTYKKIRSRPVLVCPKNGKSVVPGGKKRFKLVDRRMKKDVRALKRTEKKSNKKRRK